jgi:hypothetical protein
MNPKKSPASYLEDLSSQEIRRKYLKNNTVKLRNPDKLGGPEVAADKIEWNRTETNLK